MKTFIVVEGSRERRDVRSFEVIGRKVHSFMELMLIKS